MTDRHRNRNKKSGPYQPFTTKVISLSSEMNEETKKLIIRYQFIYSIMGLLLGLVCLNLGVLLFFNGVDGSASWTAKVLALDSQVSDAGPGAILFIVGVFIVYITRFGIKVDS